MTTTSSVTYEWTDGWMDDDDGDGDDDDDVVVVVVTWNTRRIVPLMPTVSSRRLSRAAAPTNMAMWLCVGASGYVVST